MPYAIAIVHFCEQAFRHRLVLTVDDIIFSLIFVMTIQVEGDQEGIAVPKAPEPSG